MRNLKMGKILNKTIILIVTLALLFSIPVSAAVTLDAVVTKDNATLTVSCGEDFAGKNVVVQVFEPTGSVDDLDNDGSYTVTDADILEGALACVYHGKLDDNGKVSFTVAPAGPKGIYGVRISVKNIYEITETEFVFSSDDDAQDIIDDISADADADDIAAILKMDDTISDRVYQPYQILKLDESAYYEEYDANDELKASIHANIAANLKKDATVEDFISLFEDAVVVENVDVKEGDKLREYIELNAEALGISERNEYKVIYSDPELFGEDNKLMLISAMEDYPFTGKKAVDVADKFCEEILVTLLPKSDDAPGVIDRFILDFAQTLEANGADITAYKEAKKPLDLCVDIATYAPFTSIKSFVDAINTVVEEDKEEETEVSKPSKPTGTGGGVSISGGSKGNSSVSIPVAKPEEPKKEETAQPDKTEFTDIADVAWANEAILSLKEKGIIAGRGNGIFAPNDMVTREEFVKMLSVAVGLELTDSDIKFSDVKGDEWFAPYVYAANKAGIVNGIGDGFGVGSNISRQDMAVLCARAIEYKGVILETIRQDMTFTDEISDYAKEAVTKLWAAGLVNGKSETEFASKATATRAEAAKMLYEVLKSLN